MIFEKLYLRTVTKIIFFIENILMKYELPNNPLKKFFSDNDIEKYLKLKKEYISSDVVNELFKNTNESTINFFHELAFETQIVIKKNKIDYDHGLILYHYLKKYILENKKKNINAFDFGTAVGFSSMCMSKALHDTSVNGRVYTLDILPNRKKIFWNTYFDKNGKRSRYELLSKWPELIEDIFFLQGSSNVNLNKIDVSRVNFAFIDSEHSEKIARSEFDFCNLRQMSGDIIIFDDISENYMTLKKFIYSQHVTSKYLLSEINLRRKKIILATKI